ncbi:MAG: 5'/3'-nucleotidase SurE [Clostridia bacterium]|nr:5'/3'-nucleotidase SurE [Clostridia bacterium]
MRILITNDDGIWAPGIRMLAEWARTIGEVTVVAPKVEQSGMSHAIQFVEPIEIKKVDLMEGVEAWQMDSTPADCVRFGIVGLEREYDLVLSGINRGVNVGVDLVYSGTVAAIFEAARLGHRGIAFSTFPDSQEFASQYFSDVYKFITDRDLFEKNLIFNVNIPDEVKGMHLTYQGSQYFSDTFKKGEGDMYLQVGSRIEDVCPDDIKRDTVAIHKGYISVTPLLRLRTNMELVNEK